MQGRTLWLSLFAVMVFVRAAAARDAPAGNVAIGYQTLKDSQVSEAFTAGWVASGAGSISRSWEIASEFSGSYKSVTVPPAGVRSRLALETFLGGARYVVRTPAPVRPFVQVLAGVTKVSSRLTSCGRLGEFCIPSIGETRSLKFFTVQPGVGADIALTKRVAVRLQGDYRVFRARAPFDDGRETAHEYRLAVGVAVAFFR